MPAEVVPLLNANGRNDRFTYAKVLQDGHWLFLKKAKNSELEPNLKRELLWADFVNSIAKTEPEAHIRGPQIVGFEGSGGLLMEYIDAAQVASSSDGDAWRKKIDRYARTLDILDRHANNYTVEWPPSEVTISDVDKVWQRWFGDHYEANLPTLTKARQLIVDNDAISYRVQHGDLTPWQMFEKGEDWIIYDGEKAGDHLPRFNDLAYGYGRLFTRLRNSKTAAVMLEKFINYSGIEHNTFFRQFLPIMTFRATGMLADAYNNSDHENYIREANDLIDLCFAGQLANFLPKD